MEFISPKSTFKYILKCDRDKPEEEQTIWHFFNLTADEEAVLSDSLGQVKSGSGDFAVNLGTQGLIALDLGLAEIENGNFNGNPVVLERNIQKSPIKNTKKKPWKRDVLDMIPKEERSELASVAINGGELEEEERKN